MGEENNNSNEETQALFVSTQKKKQAEEEARKKAEAEQAKRDAAEAEVRRMEQEVEERKRKAEEERRALEQAAREAEEAGASQVDKLKAKVNTAVNTVNTDAIKTMAKEKTVTVGKSKIPLFAAIGAALIVVILVAVFALKGKDGGSKTAAIDPATTEFNKEYATTTEGVDLKFFYPESVFTQVTEEGDAESVEIHLSSEGGSEPEAVLALYKFMDKGNIGFQSAKEMQNNLGKVAGGALKDEEMQVQVADEVSTDIASDNPGKYSYKCTFATEVEGAAVKGAATSWYVSNEAGDIYQVFFSVMEKAETNDNCVALRDLFEEKNSENAIKVPGENPPKEAATDGRLEVDAIHLGLVVPKDQFKKVDTGSDDFSAWSDDNGAMFIVTYEDAGELTFDDYHENYEVFAQAFKDSSDTSLNAILPDIESRMYLGDLQAPENRGGYFAEYRDVVGGITFWEGYCAGMWRDVRTNKYCFYSIILMAPEKNQDVYKQIYNTAVDRMEDI